jgi:hypothetical protein
MSRLLTLWSTIFIKSTTQFGTRMHKSSNHLVKMAAHASLAFLIGLAASGCSPSSDTTNKPRPSAQQVKPKPAPTYPVVATPSNGAIRFNSSYGERVAPFEIQTSGPSDYLVKLVSTNSGQPVMTVFVRGGQTVSTEVPLGTFEVRYAVGSTWYGYEHLFGPETSYKKADTTFTFRNDGYQYTGYTITLYTVSNGNMRTSRIGADQF